MRIKQAQLLIVPEDLALGVGRLLPPGQVTDLRIRAEEGCLRAWCRYKLGFIHIPVDLAVRVAGLTADTLELSVGAGEGSDSSLVSEVLLGLLAGGRVPGVRATGNLVRVDVHTLTAAFGVPFRLQGLRISATGITVGVADLLLPEPTAPTKARAGAIRPGARRP